MTVPRLDESPAGHPAAVRPGDGVVRILLGPTLVLLGILGASAALSLFGAAILLMYVAFALVAIAIPYTIVAVLTTVVLHLRIASRAPETDDDVDVRRFGGIRQRCSLVLAVVLLALLVAYGVVNSADPYGGTVIALSGAVIVGAVLTIVANAPQLYSRRVIALEKNAVATRTGAWRLILVSWILSPVMWIAYAGTVALIVVPSFVR